ncbi:MAG: hypothetical protein ACRC8S_05780 [Fimbriiglobus sp.]
MKLLLKAPKTRGPVRLAPNSTAAERGVFLNLSLEETTMDVRLQKTPSEMILWPVVATWGCFMVIPIGILIGTIILLVNHHGEGLYWGIFGFGLFMFVGMSYLIWQESYGTPTTTRPILKVSMATKQLTLMRTNKVIEASHVRGYILVRGWYTRIAFSDDSIKGDTCGYSELTVVVGSPEANHFERFSLATTIGQDSPALMRAGKKLAAIHGVELEAIQLTTEFCYYQDMELSPD